MRRRIVICSDGTWNRPEKNMKEDYPTNVLKLARAIAPVDEHGVPQQVFYDWGIGSEHDLVPGKIAGALTRVVNGMTGKGMYKNIKDGYRYIVHNYTPGDELFIFGFSRGAYTIRRLCGLIHQCGILKKEHADHVEKAFSMYRKSTKNSKSNIKELKKFKEKYSYPECSITFVGAWDTVGALGVPLKLIGRLFRKKYEFCNNKMALPEFPWFRLKFRHASVELRGRSISYMM